MLLRCRQGRKKKINKSVEIRPFTVCSLYNQIAPRHTKKNHPLVLNNLVAKITKSVATFPTSLS